MSQKPNEILPHRTKMLADTRCDRLRPLVVEMSTLDYFRRRLTTV